MIANPNCYSVSADTKVVHYQAINDKDGNPRRVYVLWQNHVPVKAWDEGYNGFHAIPEEFRSVPREDRNCSVGLYQDFVRMYGKK